MINIDGKAGIDDAALIFAAPTLHFDHGVDEFVEGDVVDPAKEKCLGGRGAEDSVLKAKMETNHMVVGDRNVFLQYAEEIGIEIFLVYFARPADVVSEGSQREFGKVKRVEIDHLAFQMIDVAREGRSLEGGWKDQGFPRIAELEKAVGVHRERGLGIEYPITFDPARVHLGGADSHVPFAQGIGNGR